MSEYLGYILIIYFIRPSSYESEMSVTFGSVCDECEGTGEIECDACEGKGRRIVICKMCNGESCRICKWTGQMEVECDECEDGMVACTICDSSVE